MSTISTVSSTTTSTTSSATSSSTSLSQEDFLTLLVGQLENQNPLEPTSTDQILEQTLSYASYAQEQETVETLGEISEKLDDIASVLDTLV